MRWLWIYRSIKVLKPQPHGLARAKLVVSSLLLVLKTASLAAWATSGDAATPSAVASSIVAFASAIFLIPLSQYEHNRTVRPSSLLCLYLLATTIFEITRVRTLWLLQPFSLALATVATVSLAVRALLLAIEAQEKGVYLTSAYEKASPEYKSGILNRSIYWWINGLFFHGFRSDLSLQDLCNLDYNLASKPLTSDLQRRWNGDERKHSRKHALLRHAFASAKWSIIKAVIARAVLIPLKYAQPFLFSDLIEHVSESNNQDQEGSKYGLVGAVFLVYVLIAATNAIYKRQAIQMMTIIRGGLVGIIYAEALEDKSPPGGGANALTFMSTDVDRIVPGVQNVHEMWAGSIEIVIAVALLIRRIGFCCCFGGYCGMPNRILLRRATRERKADGMGSSCARTCQLYGFHSQGHASNQNAWSRSDNHRKDSPASKVGVGCVKAFPSSYRWGQCVERSRDVDRTSCNHRSVHDNAHEFSHRNSESRRHLHNPLSGCSPHKLHHTLLPCTHEVYIWYGLF